MSRTPDTTFSLFFDMGRIMKARMEAQHLRLSMPQFETLRYISGRTAPSMREVAMQLKVKAPSATALVSELERGKLVKRVADARDRRQVRLEVTARGHTLLSDGLERRMKVLKSVLSPLSSKDREDLNRILRKIVDNA